MLKLDQMYRNCFAVQLQPEVDNVQMSHTSQVYTECTLYAVQLVSLSQNNIVLLHGTR